MTGLTTYCFSVFLCIFSGHVRQTKPNILGVLAHYRITYR